MSESDLVNPSQLSTKLEAILYLKAQPLSIQELADYAICEVEDVEEALLTLMQDYALRDSALEVVETNSGFSLQLREAYMSLVQTIVPTDLGVGALRTLAAIALKGPIPQTQLVELRGSGAYQHVGDLAEEGFVSKRRQSNGRSFSVQVTEKFYQYFEVDELPKLKLKKSTRNRRVVEENDSEQLTTEEIQNPSPENPSPENPSPENSSTETPRAEGQDAALAQTVNNEAENEAENEAVLAPKLEDGQTSASPPNSSPPSEEGNSMSDLKPSPDPDQMPAAETPQASTDLGDLQERDPEKNSELKNSMPIPEDDRTPASATTELQQN